MSIPTPELQETKPMVSGKHRRWQKRFEPSVSSQTLVLDTLTDHADMLLAVAKRYSKCTDDAYDAYQRSVEIFLRSADRLNPDTIRGWLQTVVKHEALAIQRQQRRQVPVAEDQASFSRETTENTPEDQLLDYEYVQHAATALRSLKPHERQALWLQAQGNSYREIAKMTGWTYTKVNRCITEGRRSLFGSYEEVTTGKHCQKMNLILEKAGFDEREFQSSQFAQTHLEHCMSCKARVRQLHKERRAIAMLFPLLPLSKDALEPVSQLAAQSISEWERLVVFLGSRWEALRQAGSGLRTGTAALIAVTVGATGYATIKKMESHNLEASISQSSSRNFERSTQPNLLNSQAPLPVLNNRVTQPQQNKHSSAQKKHHAKKSAKKKQRFSQTQDSSEFGFDRNKYAPNQTQKPQQSTSSQTQQPAKAPAAQQPEFSP